MHWFLSNMITGYIVGVVLSGLCIHYPYTLGIERMLRMKTKEDCIKAGRHPDIMELIPSEGLTGAMSVGNIAEMNNPLQRSVSMNAGYDTAEDNFTKLERNKDSPGFNRQDSTTSL